MNIRPAAAKTIATIARPPAPRSAAAAAGRLVVAALLIAALAIVAAPAMGQPAAHPTTADQEVPPPAPGNATIRGTVIDTERPGETGNLDVALYALRADGQPGIARAVTDAGGAFAFEAISGAPDIVYLVGVRYAEVPYGQRVTFAPGQQIIDLAVEVARPLVASDTLRVASSEIEIEWRGTRVLVSEQHRIVNAGRAVIYVPPEQRDSVAPPVTFGLPQGHEDFQTPQGMASDGFKPDATALGYFGPIYTGEQTVRFGYLLPASAAGEPVSFTSRFPTGTGALLVRTAVPGPRVSSPALGEPRTIEGEEGSFRILETGALGRQAEIALAVALPETTNDPGALRLGETEVSVELDDTVLTVTQHHRIIVAPGSHVAGAPDAPILRFTLPENADLEGLSSAAARLGIGSTPAGIDVLGPLGPGEHEFAYRYRVPAPNGVSDLSLRFPIRVPTLSVTVADTGLSIEAPRLHRLRPQRMGTRTWLRREAFQIDPSETISMRFEAIDRQPIASGASLAIVLTAGALLMLFVVSPLRRTRSVPTAEVDTQTASLERQLVYAAIRDLDHDHETGKLADSDYDGMRAELRAQAIDLLRAERAGGAPAISNSDAVAAPVQPGREPVATAGFCPSCGGQVAATWTFCSHCGGQLAPKPGAT